MSPPSGSGDVPCLVVEELALLLKFPSKCGSIVSCALLNKKELIGFKCSDSAEISVSFTDDVYVV